MKQNFRFYDNRQKYLMFVNTCSEKWVVAQRLAQELDHLMPTPPALRFFDAGVGDGTVLSRFLRVMHRRFERLPFYIAAKEISLEDIRLTLDKMPDRFFEHPEMVLALTNLPYADAPWLVPSNGDMAARLVWKTMPLKGATAADFERQIHELQPFLADLGSHAPEGGIVYAPPQFVVAGAFTVGTSGAGPNNNSQTSFGIIDTVTLSRGHHQFKIGGSYVRNRFTADGAVAAGGCGVLDRGPASRPRDAGAVSGRPGLDVRVGA